MRYYDKACLGCEPPKKSLSWSIRQKASVDKQELKKEPVYKLREVLSEKFEDRF